MFARSRHEGHGVLDNEKPATSRFVAGLRPVGLVGLLAVAVLPWTGCAQPEEEAGPELTLQTLDSVLVELGGLPAGALSRTQRWRMVSSLGPGLPPPGYTRENLPDPDSRSAGLLQAYCTQCHWMAAPQQHSAAEWPQLVRRMLMRAQTLRNRMGGPLLTELVGSEFAMAGMTASVQPPPEDVDSMIVYLQAHAMPVAQPGELGEGPDTEFFMTKCAACHEPPSPNAHTQEEWDAILLRMNGNMPIMGLEPLNQEEMARIRSFIEARRSS